MCIPYGALLLVGGLVGKLLLGWGQPAVVMLVLGTAQVLLSNLSLAAWRGGKKSTAITLSEAGLAGWLAYYAYRGLQQRVSPMLMGALLGLSAAMALFLSYNVAAGGNPPRKSSHAAASPAAAAAAALGDAPPATAS
ncbi:Protein FATTY ACID EXPORT 1 [Chlorella vulgaris]